MNKPVRLIGRVFLINSILKRFPGILAIEHVSRFFYFCPICVFIGETNTKALSTTCGHQKRFALFEAGTVISKIVGGF